MIFYIKYLTIYRENTIATLFSTLAYPKLTINHLHFFTGKGCFSKRKLFEKIDEILHDEGNNLDNTTER